MYFHAENFPGVGPDFGKVPGLNAQMKLKLAKNQPAGLPWRAGRDQRLAMYIVISKPKRMSLAAGFSHFIR